jgi:hypothetical protein
MVSSCELKFDEMSIAAQKAHVPDVFVYLFQESDRRVMPSACDDGDVEVGYFATRSAVLQRLELAGYTAERAQRAFEDWLQEERQYYPEHIPGDDGEPYQIAVELKGFGYREWQSRVGEVLRTRYDFSHPRDTYIDEIDKRMKDLDQEWLFFGDDTLTAIRAMLDALPMVGEVSLDIGPLISAGWIGPDDPICEERRRPGAHWRSILEPTVIIAEGSTDILILRRSLERLYPHLTEYITFFDYEGSGPDGGASYVVKFLRAFAAARINTPILAVFDNDAAGLEALNIACNLTLPEHINATSLPDIELARSYPTLGPQGRHEIDINGQAVSIELFLGRHNLTQSDGTLIPVVWSNYVSKVQLYQGAIQDKAGAIARFLAETAVHDASIDYGARFPELVELWSHIFNLLTPTPETE